MLSQVEEKRTTTILDITEPLLNPKQKVILKVRGRVFLRYERREGWKRSLPIYAAKCDLHGLYEDYPHGWKSELECPLCLFERVSKAHGRNSTQNISDKR